MFPAGRIEEFAEDVRAQVWLLLDPEPGLEPDLVAQVARRTSEAFLSALRDALEGDDGP